jgi:hypothetical protein
MREKLVLTPPTAALSPLPILSHFAVYHGSKLEPMNHPEEALEAQQVEAARPPQASAGPCQVPLVGKWEAPS